MMLRHFSRLLLLICLLGAGHLGFGQDKKARPQLSTPRQAVRTHLLFLQEEYQNSEQADKYINYSLKALRNPRLSPSTIRKLPELTVKLKEIFDGLGQYIELETIPDDPNYRDSTRDNRYEYLLFEAKSKEVYLKKVGDYWYYSVETVEAIPQLHAEIYVVNLSAILSDLGVPPEWKKPAKVLVFLLLTALTFLLLTLIFNRLLVRIAQRLGYLEELRTYISPLARPASILVTLILMKLLLPSLGMPPRIASVVVIIFKFLVPFFAVVVVFRAVSVIGKISGRIASRTESTLDDQLVPLLIKTFKVLVVVFGGLAILQQLGVDTDRFWTGISIGGLAFALAAQDTLKNFFGSLMIFVDRPFQIGDWIKSDGVNGTVEEIGFRSTRIRTFEDAVTSIPNGRLADATIDNMGLRRQRRFLTTIALTYDTPPHLLDAYLKGLRRIADEHPAITPNTHRIHFNAMGDSSLNVLVYCYLTVKDYDHELIAKEELFFAFVRLAEHLGIRFAFPTSTLHVEEVPGQPSLTPTYSETDEDFDRMLNAFFQQNQIRHRSKAELGQLDHKHNHPGGAG